MAFEFTTESAVLHVGLPERDALEVFPGLTDSSLIPYNTNIN